MNKEKDFESMNYTVERVGGLFIWFFIATVIFTCYNLVF